MIPIVSVIVSIGIVLRQFGVLKDAELKHGEALVRLGSAMQTRSEADRLVQDKSYAAVFNSAAEQNTFLLDLKEKASGDQVTIANWISSTGNYGEPSGPITADGKPESLDLVRGFSRIDCSLNMTGSYSGMRKLVGEIEGSNRLFNLSKIAWSRGPGGTSLGVVVSRYLAPVDRAKQINLAVPGPSSDKFTGAN
jgi:hypothetical protein